MQKNIDDYLIELEKRMSERGYKRHARLIWDKKNGVALSFTVRYSHENFLVEGRDYIKINREALSSSLCEIHIGLETPFYLKD